MRALRRHRVALGVTLLALGTSDAFADPGATRSSVVDAGAPVPWMRDRTDPRWAYGMVVVRTEAARVRERLRDVDAWPRLFSDIRTLQVVRRGGDAWTVRLQTATFDCGPHDYRVQFLPDGNVHLVIDAPGIDAVARMEVRDAQTPGRAVVTYRLFVDARGVVGWFVSEAALRRRQESMVVRYLSDLRRAFGP